MDIKEILPASSQQLILNKVIDSLIIRAKNSPVVGELSERLETIKKELEALDQEADAVQAECNRIVLETLAKCNERKDALQAKGRELIGDLITAADNVMTPTGLQEALTAVRAKK